MPSLHVGMAPVVAWALIRLTPWLWTKALGVAYPLLVAVSIVVTGNHFVLDIAGGLAVVLPAAADLGLAGARAPAGAVAGRGRDARRPPRPLGGRARAGAGDPDLIAPGAGPIPRG